MYHYSWPINGYTGNATLIRQRRQFIREQFQPASVLHNAKTYPYNPTVMETLALHKSTSQTF